jgi:hypothetical protein
MLQMAVSALYLYILYKQGVMSCNLYIPFTDIALKIHPLVYIFFAMFVMVGCVNAVNITDGVDGYLIKGRNIKDFVDKVCLLIENPGLRRQMGRTAIRSSKRYHADRIMPAWYNLFDLFCTK